MKVVDNWFYRAMAFIITMLFAAVFLFVKYYKRSWLYLDFMLARDPVLRHFDQPKKLF